MPATLRLPSAMFSHWPQSPALVEHAGVPMHSLVTEPHQRGAESPRWWLRLINRACGVSRKPTDHLKSVGG
ncbi:MAG: hypothetical protein ACXADX_03770 [Candidatus Hodarchaeales archaeon]